MCFIIRGSIEVGGFEVIEFEKKDFWVMMNFYKFLNSKLLRVNGIVGMFWGLCGVIVFVKVFLLVLLIIFLLDWRYDEIWVLLRNKGCVRLCLRNENI